MKRRFVFRILALFLTLALLLPTTSAPASAAQGEALPAIQLQMCYSHAAALVNDELYLWGSNTFRQLIGLSDLNVLTPTKVASGIADVEVTTYCTLVITQSGQLVYYGVNPATNDTSGPSGVVIASGVADVAVGYDYVVFLKTDGTVWSYGSNQYGQLGLGDTERRDEPTQVMGGAVKIAAGNDFVLALKGDGSVYGWGDNLYLQLNQGDASTTILGQPHEYDYVYTPMLVTTGAKDISCGSQHTAVLKTDGSLWVCGNSDYGQCGTGAYFPGDNLNHVLSDVVGVAAGGYHTLAVTQAGRLYVWGRNDYYQLGGWSSDNMLTPAVFDYVGYIAVGAGLYSSLAVTVDGTLWGWGDNHNYVLGDARGLVMVEQPIIIGKLFEGTALPPGGPTDPPDPNDPVDPSDPADPTDPTDPGSGTGSGAGSGTGTGGTGAGTGSSTTTDPYAFVNGYPDGTFRPDATVSRSEFVKMLVVAAGVYDPSVDYGSSFPDVSSSDWHANYTACAKVLGITTGYTDGNFHALEPITRAEAAVMVARAFQIPSASSSSRTFPDLPADHWAAGAVYALSNRNILTGYIDGTFLPGGTVYRCETATMLLRAQNRVPTQSEWPSILLNASNPFSDLAPSYWAYVYIMRAAGIA